MQPLETGDDLLTARSALQITQAQLADTLRVSLSTIKRAERAINLDTTMALAVECLLRRRAASHQKAVSPEERAERKFREKQRLRELQEEAGWSRGKSVSAVAAGVERAKLRAVVERNAERDRVRHRITHCLAVLQPLTEAERRNQIAVWVGMTKIPDMVSRYLADFYVGLEDGTITAMDDPRITLPLEPSE